MPYDSKSQMRLFFHLESKGKLPKGTAKRWADHTPSTSDLPERKPKMSMCQKLASLSKSGNVAAQIFLSMVKSSAVGRGEGFGVTNGLVTARSGLMSPHSLTSTKNAQPTLPMAGTMPLGQLAQPSPSTIGSPVGMPKAAPASVLPNTSMVNKSGNSVLILNPHPFGSGR